MSPPVILPDRYSSDLRIIGRGGFGAVYRTTDIELGCSVAVKVPFRGADQSLAREVMRELHAGARLRHPNIVQVLDAGTDPEGRPYLVMEYAGEGSFRSLVDSPPPWPDVLPLLDGLLAALGHAHTRGLVHRDIKAQNVLFATRNGERVPKLADFGLAKVASLRGEFASTRVAAGTLLYMAPEIFSEGLAGVHPVADLYAFGVLLHLLATGGAPWEGKDWDLVDHKLAESRVPYRTRDGYAAPEGLSELVDRLLDPVPAKRFQLAADVRTALAEISGVSSPVRRPGAVAESFPATPATAVVRVPNLVGREDECALLLGMAERAESGPVSVVVGGPAGAGKSRLCSWLGSTLEEEGRARCLHVRLDGEFSPWDSVGAGLRSLLGLGRLTGDKLERRLEQLPAAYGEGARGLIRGLAELLDPGVEPSMAGPTRLAAARTAVVDRLLRFEASRGLVMVHVDENRATPGARELVEGLHQAALAAPYARLLLHERREEAEPTPADGFEHLRVGPLADDACRAILRDLLPGGEGGEDLMERLGGSPLRAVEAARLRGEQGAADPGPTLDADGLLDVAEVATARFAAFLTEDGPARAEMLALLALAPRPTPPALLQQVLAGAGAVEALGAARAAGLVRITDHAEVAFASGALAEAAERLAVSRDDHSRLAGVVADALLSLPDPQPARFGLHAAQLCATAGRHERALDLAATWARRLVDRDVLGARRAWSVAEAACTALGLSDGDAARVEVELGRARVARATGEVAEAERLLSGLARDQLEPSQRGLHLELSASIAVVQGSPEGAIRAARDGGAEYEREGDSAGTARTALLEGEALYQAGRSREAVRAFTRARALAVEAGADREELHALWRLARCRRVDGATDIARREFTEALALSELLGTVVTEGTIRRELGNLDLVEGRLDDAAEQYERAIERLEAGGFRGQAATTRISLGELARSRGDLAGAREQYASALTITQAYGLSGDALVSLLNLAMTELAMERLPAAARRLRAVEDLMGSGDHRLRPYASAVRFAVAAAEGDWERAEAALEDLDSVRHTADADLLALVERGAESAKAAGAAVVTLDATELARSLAAALDAAQPRSAGSGSVPMTVILPDGARRAAIDEPTRAGPRPRPSPSGEPAPAAESRRPAGRGAGLLAAVVIAVIVVVAALLLSAD